MYAFTAAWASLISCARGLILARALAVSVRSTLAALAFFAASSAIAHSGLQTRCKGFDGVNFTRHTLQVFCFGAACIKAKTHPSLAQTSASRSNPLLACPWAVDRTSA